MSGKGKGKGIRRRKKDEEEWKPTPNRPIVKERIVPLQEMSAAVEDSISVLKKYSVVLDDNNYTATTFFRLRSSVVIDVIDPTHVDPESLRVKILLALRDNKPLVIDLKKYDENLIKLFDTVQLGLFEAMWSVGGDWYKEKLYRNLVLAEDLETMEITPDFIAPEPFKGIIITMVSSNPPAYLLDNFAILRVVPEVRHPPNIITDTRNPAGLETKKKKGKKKKAR